MRAVLPRVIATSAPGACRADAGLPEPRRGWRRQLERLTWPAAAALVGVVASTQFLIQPFVWRHWEVSDVVAAWGEIARDRVVVAIPIGLALAWTLGIRGEPNARLWLRVGGAVLVGAAAGEASLWLIGSRGAAGSLAASALRIVHWSSLAVALSGLLLLWRRMLDAQAAAREAELARVQAQRASALQQLQALRSQIEPHFLFNTLATVRRLGSTDRQQGESLLRHLIDFLRLAGATPHAGLIELGAELGLVRAYLEIVAQRMDGRLAFSFDVDPTLLEVGVPPYCLATLVENAVKHGIEPSSRGGTIAVAAWPEPDGRVKLAVTDSGVGLRGGGGSGIGLANIRTRLAAQYGERAQLRLRANTPSGVYATIVLPLADVEVSP